jgi:hypothetical protein
MQRRPLKPVGAGLAPAHPTARGEKAGKSGEPDENAPVDDTNPIP